MFLGAALLTAGCKSAHAPPPAGSSEERYQRENERFARSSYVSSSLFRSLSATLRSLEYTPADLGPATASAVSYQSEVGQGDRYPSIWGTHPEGRLVQLFSPSRLRADQQYTLELLRLNPYTPGVAALVTLHPESESHTLVVGLPHGQHEIPLNFNPSDILWHSDRSLLVLDTPLGGAQSLKLIEPDTGSVSHLYQAPSPEHLLRMHRPSSEDGLFVLSSTPRRARIYWLSRTSPKLQLQFSFLETQSDIYSALSERLNGSSFVAVNRVSKPPQILDERGQPIWSGPPHSLITQLHAGASALYFVLRQRGKESLLAVSPSSLVATQFALPPLLAGNSCSYGIEIVPREFQRSGVPLIALRQFTAPRIVTLPDHQQARLVPIDADQPPPLGAQLLSGLRCQLHQLPNGVTYSLIDRAATTAPPHGYLLRVYGAYGTALLPHYDPLVLTLAHRGIGVAFIHTHGGSEFGAEWHEPLRKTSRSAAIMQVDSVRDALQRANAKIPLVLWGQSAGALLAANVVRRHPQHYHGLLVESPFLDPFDTAVVLPRAIETREKFEWGDRDNPREAPSLKALSLFTPPFVRYPPTLITASVYDRVTGIGQALRFVDLARAHGQPESYLLSSFSGSHTGEQDRYLQRDQRALVAGFVLKLVQENSYD